MGRFEGKVVVVTGAAQGQGAAQASRFRDEGATVISGDVIAPTDPAPDITYQRLDVSDLASWDALVDELRGRFGRLDVLVNNAGISRGTDVRGT